MGRAGIPHTVARTTASQPRPSSTQGCSLTPQKAASTDDVTGGFVVLNAACLSVVTAPF